MDDQNSGLLHHTIKDIKPMSPPPSPPLQARHSSRWASHEDIESMSPRTSPPTTVSNYPKLTSRLSKKETLPRKPNGRMIHYYIADGEGNVNESYENFTIIFEGSEVQELAHRLEEEMGMVGVIVCTRNVLTGQLSPVRLHLPPYNAKLNVVVVSSSSKDSETQRSRGDAQGIPIPTAPIHAITRKGSFEPPSVKSQIANIVKGLLPTAYLSWNYWKDIEKNMMWGKLLASTSVNDNDCKDVESNSTSYADDDV